MLHTWDLIDDHTAQSRSFRRDESWNKGPQGNKTLLENGQISCHDGEIVR